MSISTRIIRRRIVNNAVKIVVVAAMVLACGAGSAEAQWMQVGSDIDGEAAGDESGWSVSLSADGTSVAIGAARNDGSGVDSGHVRAYEWDDGTASWVQVGSDIDGEAAGDLFGNSISFSADGSRLAIGAYGNRGNGYNSGHVRVYEWDSGTADWVQLGSDIDGEAAGDMSGWSVTLSADGTSVAIGAVHNGGNGNYSGHVRLYEWNSGTASWDQLGADIDGETAGDMSGYSVSLSADGSRVAIGATGNDSTGGANSGHARVYEWDSGTASWVQVGSDIDGEAADDYFGESVSLSMDGSLIAIGGRLNDGNGFDSGHVRIYEWNSGTATWVQVGSDIDGEAAGDTSGISVSLAGDGRLVAIGAPHNSGSGFIFGQVRVYEWDSAATSWVQLGSDIEGEALGAEFGYSVSISADGTHVAGGAIRNGDNGIEAGQVRVYRVPVPKGACCVVTGACIETTDAACMGTWQGAGTTCAGNPCPTPQTGSIVAWGDNTRGQCNVPTDTDFVAVSAGSTHSVGLKVDGSVVAWGSNQYGQSIVPTLNTGFVAIAGIGDHTIGLKDDGSLAPWGQNNYGQCNIPAPNTDFVAVAGGVYHSLGVKSDGSVVAWGWNGHGQCNVPAPNSDFVAVAAGYAHSAGLKADGSIVVWGSTNGGLHSVPAPNTGFVAVMAGEWHNLGLRSDGSIAAWGANSYGQCNVPAPNTDFVAIACRYHSLGLKADGSLAAWGWCTSGQCNVPPPNTNFVAVSAGYTHTLGLIIDNEAPTLDVDNSPTTGVTGSAYTFDITASDNVAVQSVTVTWSHGALGGTDEALNDDGDGTWSLGIVLDNSTADMTYTITVTDTSANFFTSTSSIVTVFVDCNRNGIPDDSELTDNDCNANVVPDECDIDSGSSPDGNVNDIPDECEGPTLYVDTDAVGLNNGTSWSDAYIALQSALETAVGSGGAVTEIRVAQGTYKPDHGVNQTLGDRSATFQLVSGVALRGGYAGWGEADPNARDIALYETILTGDLDGDDLPAFVNYNENSLHVVTGSGMDATAVLDGLTIAGGNAGNGGGGMYNASGSPTLLDCTFAYNTNGAQCGGGMYNLNSHPVLTRCKFIGNRTTSFTNGGGMCNSNSSPALVSCIFRDNYASTCGGAMYNMNPGSSPALVSCILSGNRANYGGGAVFNHERANPTLINCVLTGNSANNRGGALYTQEGADATLINCSLAGNSAPNGRSLACHSFEGLRPANITITSSILWNGGNEIWMDDSSAITISHSDIQSVWPGAGNISSDPMFVDADGADNIIGTEDDNLRLSPGSPCVDAGDNTAIPLGVTIDLDGNPRISACDVDMGAYEHQQSLPDTDGDTVLDVCDNCPNDSNAGQEDTDEDGVGDACDPCPLDNPDDSDGDGICDSNDICPGGDDTVDTDSDTVPDFCDDDDDNDGVLDGSDSNPLDPTQCEDSDGDMCDDCAVGTDGFGPLPDNDPNNDGTDTDGDSQCDLGDPDDDNDGVDDVSDPSPFDPALCGDSDSDTCDDCSILVDGFGPLSDYDPANDGADMDGDGICDAGDNCPNDPGKIEPGLCGCSDAPTDCSDGNVCTTDSCVEGTGCINNGIGVTNDCDDNDTCTMNDVCQGDATGTCQGNVVIVDPVLLDPDNPGTSCCSGGDNYGLACMTCNGGGRDGELCMDSDDCTGGGTCETNDSLCPGSTCGGVSVNLGINTIAWPKSRYIGVQPNSTAAGMETAIRVKMIDINGNTNCNGEVRWAGPPIEFCEGGACTTLFYGSQLQTTPHWIDWTTMGVVQLYGEEVIPDSRYAIQMISKECETLIDNETFYSSPALMVDSAKWGDVVPPMFPFTAAAQPAISDVLKLVDKWLGNLEPRKSRSQLQPAVINPTSSVGIADVLKGVDAWLGTPYPFSITTCP